VTAVGPVTTKLQSCDCVSWRLTVVLGALSK